MHAILMLLILPFRGQFRPPSFNFRLDILARGKNNFVDCYFLIIYKCVIFDLSFFILFYFITERKKPFCDEIMIHTKPILDEVRPSKLDKMQFFLALDSDSILRG
jgi:hypothetical protein